MTKYLFLDSWAFNKFTKGDKQGLLSKFIQENNYTILIDSLSFTELYNPEPSKDMEKDRDARVVNFLGQHSCVIVDPQNLWRSEFDAFPGKLDHIPIELNLDNIRPDLRGPAILMLLRRDPIYLEQGKDIGIWVDDYEKLKSTWVSDAQNIIAQACATGVLKKELTSINVSSFFVQTLWTRRDWEPHVYTG